MNKLDYKNELLGILREHSNEAELKIRDLLPLMPKKAKTLEFGVFPDQDGEGTFSVVIGLGGPDLYALNRSIEKYRYIFNVVHTETGLVPNVPYFDPDEVDFSVNDMIVDTVVIWLKEIWENVGCEACPIPAFIFSDEGYGTETHIDLF